jgi:hypothetical protein
MAAKVKTASKTIKDPELINMFNQMVGASDPDPEIVLPKYECIMKNLEETVLILEAFVKSPFAMAFQLDFNKGFLDCREFLARSRKELEELVLKENDKILTAEDLNELNQNPQKMTQALANMNLRFKVTGLKDVYIRLKDSQIIKEIIITTRNLKNILSMEKQRSLSQVHDLEQRASLSSNFILKADGDFIVLLSFSSLDFKQIYLHTLMTEEYSNYILFVLFLLYKKFLIIVKELVSPDIDVNKFSEILIDNIEEIRKHIPRCDKAFNKIRQSVDLLKTNFGEYYKDFISSQNPGIIIEHFVLDVSASSTEDPVTTRQFRDIIKFYRDHMQNRIKDPKINKIFQMVSQNLDILEDKEKKTAEKTEPESEKK